MTRPLPRWMFPTLLGLAACSGESDEATGGDTGPTDPTTDDSPTFATRIDSGGAGDDDDDLGTTTTPTEPDTWEMTVPCDATHTLDTLVFNTNEAEVFVDLDGAATVGTGEAWEFRMDTWFTVVGDGVEVAGTNGTYDRFDTLCQAPPTGFSVDADGLSTWYLYTGPPDHRIEPRDKVFFLRTTDGSYYRLRFDSYYAVDDRLHTPSITFGPVAPPEG